MVGTKTDVVFAVITVNRFIFTVGPPHWIDVKCIMKYLKCMLDLERQEYCFAKIL